MGDTIADLFIKVIDDLSKLVSDLRKGQSLTPEQLRLDNWNDELGRLRLCEADLGLDRTALPMLAENLRDSSHISNQISKILHELQATIQDASLTLSNPESPEGCQHGYSETEDERPETELRQLYESTVTMIDCLLQMSALSRQPARHDFLLAQPSVETAFRTGAIHHDQDTLRKDFPRADHTLIQRLALSIGQNREYLEYRKNMTLPISNPITVWETQQNLLPSPYDIKDATQEDYTSEFDSPLGLSTSTLGSAAVGPPAVAANERLFECTLCCFPVLDRDRHSWRRHIFSDLRPYICTAADCDSPHTKYAKRSEWIYHMQNSHALEWAGMHANYEETAMQQQQKKGLCPLCMDPQLDGRAYQQHLAHHLENITLAAFRGVDAIISESSPNPSGDILGQDPENTKKPRKNVLIAKASDNPVELSQSIGKNAMPSSHRSPSLAISTNAISQEKETERSLSSEVTTGKAGSTKKANAGDELEKKIPDRRNTKAGSARNITTQDPDQDVASKTPDRRHFDRRERPNRRSSPPSSQRGMNEYFVNGKGIHREVLQREVCKYLGPEAYSRPSKYNGISGFTITAVRPFTQKMLDELQELSRSYVDEVREATDRGFQGIPYDQSQTHQKSTTGEIYDWDIYPNHTPSDARSSASRSVPRDPWHPRPDSRLDPRLDRRTYSNAGYPAVDPRMQPRILGLDPRGIPTYSYPGNPSTDVLPREFDDYMTTVPQMGREAGYPSAPRVQTGYDTRESPNTRDTFRHEPIRDERRN